MKQWILRKSAKTLDDLVMIEKDIPEPGADEVRVKVNAVSLNYRDIVVMRGDVGMGVDHDIIPLSDCVGIVDKLGNGVTQFDVGDRVVSELYGGWLDGAIPATIDAGLGSNDVNGTLSEYIIVAKDRLIEAPHTLGDEEAATLPCAGLTAWSALNGNRPYLFRIKKGQKVLILGTGGLALMAADIAKAFAADVYMTTSRNDKIAKLKSSGIVDVFNYRDNPEWGHEVYEKTGGGVDFVVNTAGLLSVNQSLCALKNGGVMSLVGAKGRSDIAPDHLTIIRKNIILFGVLTGSHAAYQDYINFIDQNNLTIPVAAIFQFADARKAYQQVIEANLMGKIVIRVAPSEVSHN